MSDLEQIRSLRRAALVGDRKEILATMGGRDFTIKDARDLLLKYSHHRSQGPDKEYDFYITRSWIIHFVWRKHFTDYTYLKRGRMGTMHYDTKWVQKDEAHILLPAEQANPLLKRFVNTCIKALIAKGLIKSKPDRRDDGNLVYWLTEDGNLLATAAWSTPLTKEKADALIQGVLDRAMIVAQNPDEYLVEVTVLGVFGSYTDERVSSYNDVDVLYNCRNTLVFDKKSLSHEEWRERAEEMFERDGRTRQSIFRDFHFWPHEKVGQFLRSRKRQLRLIADGVSRSIHFKVLYQYPHGILKEPFFVDLPNGSHGPEWDILTGRNR